MSTGISEAARIARIEARTRPLALDECRPATMFAPALIYYADRTRVVMRAGKTVRRGVTFGMADGAAPYAYQAVRWHSGGADLVAPHALHRAPANGGELVVECEDCECDGMTGRIVNGACTNDECPALCINTWCREETGGGGGGGECGDCADRRDSHDANDARARARHRDETAMCPVCRDET